MTNRQIAILDFDNTMDLNSNGNISKFDKDDDITIFMKNGSDADPKLPANVKQVGCSQDISSEPDARNFIIDWYEKKGFTGFLHVVDSKTVILKDISKFMEDLEHMMGILDYPVWLSTTTDPCNYVYSKYNPRLRIMLNPNDSMKMKFGGSLLFTSHSNTSWVAYDMSKQDEVNALKFNSSFKIPMFYIIELLARRRMLKKDGQLFFMNMYMTVDSEHGAFAMSKDSMAKDKFTPEELKAEDSKFAAMKIDYKPDNNIDVVLESVLKKIRGKLNS